MPIFAPVTKDVFLSPQQRRSTMYLFMAQKQKSTADISTERRIFSHGLFSCVRCLFSAVQLGMCVWFCVLVLSGCKSMAITRADSGRCIDLPISEVNGWIDRIEGNCAILYRECGKIFILRRSSLPSTVREGDFITRGKPDPVRRRALWRQIRQLVPQQTPQSQQIDMLSSLTRYPPYTGPTLPDILPPYWPSHRPLLPPTAEDKLLPPELLRHKKRFSHHEQNWRLWSVKRKEQLRQRRSLKKQNRWSKSKK
jgi:hypothetical protein